MTRLIDGSKKKRRRSAAALLFCVLLFFISLVTVLHPHREFAGQIPCSTASAEEACAFPVGFSSATREASPEIHLGIQAAASDCALCDFAATPVVQSIEYQASYLPLLVQVPRSLASRVLPFHPYRFADRSSARAPPAGA